MKFWVLVDLSSNHNDSRRYLWWFSSKKAAKGHRKTNTNLSKPIKVRASKKMREHLYEGS